VEPYLLVFKKLVKANDMSEQTVALKTAVKGKGKTAPLAGLLRRDRTGQKRFFKAKNNSRNYSNRAKKR
jgi:hypothetical protein